ncbi:MAG TPA: hypothetical protein PLE43_08070 [Alphaproteobacteria bacterium]|nr:hypothetical protein [Alphaproteobacteria bacterium]MCB9984541.1 hypothetical protein [Micavibrio sp.]HPQ50319.1 hypothetical protein [Alphaproteobacteria bacterium]HRK98415.1 hypothetical protein [Alphaproteobacteria bacterium]
MLSVEKAEVAHLLQMSLSKMAYDPERGTDIRLMLQVMGGVLTETAFFFEEPDETLAAIFTKISAVLGCDAYEGELPVWLDLDPVQIDTYTERGRELARMAIHDWADCEFGFVEMLVMVCHHVMASWEEEGIPRTETFRLLIEYATRCMCFEVAAQELCDVLIEKKMGRDGWTLGDCLGGLSGAAGWRLAKLNLLKKKLPKESVPTPETSELDYLVTVMTAEATRMGVPAGSDWKFGLAANDAPVNPPVELLDGVEPYAQLFFSAVPMSDVRDQAVACAKAAGRMLAVVATGDEPEIAHVIAKPLAMMAITETYHAFWLGY